MPSIQRRCYGDYPALQFFDIHTKNRYSLGQQRFGLLQESR